MSRKSIDSAILVATLVGVLGLIFVVSPCGRLIVRPILAIFDSRYVSGEVAPIPFDRDLWFEGKARHRVGMAHHMANEGLLDGKTREQLVEMLGVPDAELPGDEGTRWILGYVAKGMFDESLWLELTIGEDGTASGAIVNQNWDDPRER